MEATGFSTKLAHGIPMNENGWIKGGFGLGFVDRRVSLIITKPEYKLSDSPSEVVFL